MCLGSQAAEYEKKLNTVLGAAIRVFGHIDDKCDERKEKQLVINLKEAGITKREEKQDGELVINLKEAGITEREVKKAYQAASYILENAALLPISGRQVLKGILTAIWQEELQNAVTTLQNAMTTLQNAAGVTAHAGDKFSDPVEYCLRLAERTSPDEK